MDRKILSYEGAFGVEAKYLYQAVILSFAGVSDGYTDNEKARKTRLIAPAVLSVQCKSINFNVVDGNVLNFAIAKQFDSFIIDVVHRWKWGAALNQVDKVDGRSLLDYTYDECATEYARGSSIANKLNGYITALERNGAKRVRDL